MKFLLTLPLLVVGSSAWQLDFYAGSQCRGALMGGKTVNQGPSTCVNLGLANIDSVEIRSNGHDNTQLEFYNGNNCGGGMVTLVSDPSCAVLSLGEFGSVGTVSK